MALVLSVAAGLSPGCSDKPGKPPPPGDAGRRRVFTKPPGTVRVVPPFAIRSEGVGPYLLGARLKDVLSLLPRGPRVALIEIEEVIQYSLVQAEDDKLVIGAERNGGVTFVTVLNREIALTESGAAVGATKEKLDEAMGARAIAGNRAADPHISRFVALPNVRFVLVDDRAVAVAVTDEDRPPPIVKPPVEGAAPVAPPPVAAEPARCQLAAVRDAEAAIRDTAGLDKSADVAFGCADPSTPLAVVTEAGKLGVVAGDADKLRKLRADSPGDELLWGAPIDVDGDGADEVALVMRHATPTDLSMRVEVHRIEGGRLQRVAATEVYAISSKSARWAGAQLSHIELLLELRASENTVSIGGLYVQRAGRVVRIVAPLAHQRLSVRARGQTEPSTPASTSDAGPAPDAGLGRGKPPRVDAGPRPRRPIDRRGTTRPGESADQRGTP